MKYTPSKPGRGYLRNLLQAVLLLVVAPALVFADSVPDTVQEHKLVRVVLNPDQKCFVLSAGLEPVDTVKTDEGVVFTGAPGRYVVLMIGDSDTSQEFVEITSKAPQPVPPGPGPVPPGPQPPTPTPAPIAGQGLRVLILYESQAIPPKTPQAQYDAMFDQRVRTWLTQNCVAGTNNIAEWRMIDPDGLIPQTPEPWASAAKRPRTSLPWVLISNGTTNKGYEGPVPANATEFLKLLEGFKQ